MGRIEKVNQLIRREIGMIIQEEIQDPRLQFVTITHADVSPDLQTAKVGFSIIGDKQQIEMVLQTLNHAKGYIKRLIAKRVQLRYIPEIYFVYDDSIEYGARIEQTIQELHQQRKMGEKDLNA